MFQEAFPILSVAMFSERSRLSETEVNSAFHHISSLMVCCVCARESVTETYSQVLHIRI